MTMDFVGVLGCDRGKRPRLDRFDWGKTPVTEEITGARLV